MIFDVLLPRKKNEDDDDMLFICNHLYNMILAIKPLLFDIVEGER